MRRIGEIRSKLSALSVIVNSHIKPTDVKLIQYPNRMIESSYTTSVDSGFSIQSSSSSLFTVSINFPDDEKIQSLVGNDSDNDDEVDDALDDSNDFDDSIDQRFSSSNEDLSQDVKTVMDITRGCGSNRLEMKNKLEQCGVKVSSELVVEVLSRVRNDWETAFTFFLWAASQPNYTRSLREYHSMISILGKMRKFDTAWALIDEMKGGRTGPSLVTSQTLLILIRRYCAVHDVGRAINAFYAYKRFKLDFGMEEFQGLLSALCRYKNVQDAEHLMLCNKDVYPYNTKSFNIILNGWCNIICSRREAERVWKEMGTSGIQHDVVSFSCIISCYSKTHSVNKVLKVFNQMKSLGIEPDRKVYNAVIHALAKARFVKEAVNLLKTMEEKGIPPNVVTYNSIIKPLCKGRKMDEAKMVFDGMLQRGLSPTIRTYHAFMRILRTDTEVFELLEKMRNMGCQPTNETYIMLIRKFCRWRQFDNVFRLWDEKIENGIDHDRSSYIVLIHGLFLNGKLEEACKYYTEMKEKQFPPEPKIEEILNSWLSDKRFAQQHMEDLGGSVLDCSQSDKPTRFVSNKLDREKNFLREPETRKVVRERGFSFWEN